MSVFVYPEKTREELGAIRWQISWEQLNKSPEEIDKKGDFNPDEDLHYYHANYTTEAKARAAARKILDGNRTAYGCLSLVKQTVDWYVEEDRIAEWKDCGDSEEIS